MSTNNLDEMMRRALDIINEKEDVKDKPSVPQNLVAWEDDPRNPANAAKSAPVAAAPERKLDPLPYTDEFQRKLIALAVQDEDFRRYVKAHLEPRQFNNTDFHWAFKKIKELPDVSPFVLRQEALKHFKDVDWTDLTDARAIKIVLAQCDQPILPADADYIERTLPEFVRIQEWRFTKEVEQEFIQDPSDTNFQKTIEAMRKAREAAELVKGDSGANHKERRAARRKEVEADMGRIVPTLIPGLDKALNGGIRARQTGIYVAKTNGGKSAYLQYLAVSAAEQGKKVVLITLELSRTDIEARMDSQLTQIPYTEYESSQDEVDRQLAYITLNENIVVKEFPAGTNHTQIEAYLRQLDEMPDMLLIDYIDLMSPVEHKKFENENMKDVARDVVEMGKRLGIPIWTASQVNRAGLVEKRPQLDQIAGSIEKLFKADIVLIQYRDEDMLDDELGLWIAKSRKSKKDVGINVVTKFETMTFCDRNATLSIPLRREQMRAIKEDQEAMTAEQVNGRVRDGLSDN